MTNLKVPTTAQIKAGVSAMVNKTWQFELDKVAVAKAAVTCVEIAGVGLLYAAAFSGVLSKAAYAYQAFKRR